MDLSHTFTVPLPVEETWEHFQDIGALAECFPGATVSDFDESTFAGSVKVKLGPIALVYNGSGTFVEKDDAAHRFVVDAKGKDKRGNGTAGAKVNLSMSDSGGTTTVEVLTDLAITGKPAQFGRGVMQDVSDKLLGQFVACLEQRLTAEPAEAEPVAASAPAEPAAPDTATTETASPIGDAAAAATSAGTSGASSAAAPRPVSSIGSASSARSGSGASTGASGGDDALDLGAAVIPVLVKGYWKQGVGAALVLAVLAWLVGRRD